VSHAALAGRHADAYDVTQRVIVLAKNPCPGLVKTRLTPQFTPGEAAALAQAAICDTFAAVGASGVQGIAAWDGLVPRWLPDGTRVVMQRGDGLAERLSNAFEDVLHGEADRPTLLVGMDTPQLVAADLAFDWSGHDAVLGLTADGGYWAIGFRRYDERAIRGIPMSTATTGALQLDRLRSLGMRVRLLPAKRDVDTAADASAVASLAPHTRFARLHHRIVSQSCSPITLFDAALSGSTVTARQVSAPTDPSDRTLPADATSAVGPRQATALASSPGVLLAVEDWQTMTSADELLVSRCEPPVLDLGCGPGRFVEWLAARGLAALGIDISANAVAQTSARGGSVLLRDIGERLPAEGRWGTVLLADGNIGIGGDPERLLARCHDLLRDGGIALVEADADDDVDTRLTLTLHSAEGRRSTPMPWARAGSGVLVRLAGSLGFVAVEEWRVDNRVFLALRRMG
jgi:glycosyltransferase A (GT-A) superfamily protein (DUF2064 family)/SAM-dependent methyltransferase